MAYTVFVKMFDTAGEVMESHTYQFETQEEVDREVMLLKLKYPFTEFEISERQKWRIS